METAVCELDPLRCRRQERSVAQSPEPNGIHSSAYRLEDRHVFCSDCCPAIRGLGSILSNARIRNLFVLLTITQPRSVRTTSASSRLRRGSSFAP
jgi:hypothetical protein